MGQVVCPSVGEHDAFVELVKRLRSMGAVRVRDGGLEVSFAEPERAPAAAEPSRGGERLSLSLSERNELAELRAYKAEQEELG